MEHLPFAMPRKLRKRVDAGEPRNTNHANHLNNNFLPTVFNLDSIIPIPNGADKGINLLYNSYYANLAKMYDTNENNYYYDFVSGNKCNGGRVREELFPKQNFSQNGVNSEPIAAQKFDTKCPTKINYNDNNDDDEEDYVNPKMEIERPNMSIFKYDKIHSNYDNVALSSPYIPTLSSGSSVKCKNNCNNFANCITTINHYDSEESVEELGDLNSFESKPASNFESNMPKEKPETYKFDERNYIIGIDNRSSKINYSFAGNKFQKLSFRSKSFDEISCHQEYNNETCMKEGHNSLDNIINKFQEDEHGLDNDKTIAPTEGKGRVSIETGNNHRESDFKSLRDGEAKCSPNIEAFYNAIKHSLKTKELQKNELNRKGDNEDISLIIKKELNALVPLLIDNIIGNYFQNFEKSNGHAKGSIENVDSEHKHNNNNEAKRKRVISDDPFTAGKVSNKSAILEKQEMKEILKSDNNEGEAIMTRNDHSKLWRCSDKKLLSNIAWQDVTCFNDKKCFTNETTSHVNATGEDHDYRDNSSNVIGKIIEPSSSQYSVTDEHHKLNNTELLCPVSRNKVSYSAVNHFHGLTPNIYDYNPYNYNYKLDSSFPFKHNIFPSINGYHSLNLKPSFENIGTHVNTNENTFKSADSTKLNLNNKLGKEVLIADDYKSEKRHSTINYAHDVTPISSRHMKLENSCYFDPFKINLCHTNTDLHKLQNNNCPNIYHETTYFKHDLSQLQHSDIKIETDYKSPLNNEYDLFDYRNLEYHDLEKKSLNFTTSCHQGSPNNRNIRRLTSQDFNGSENKTEIISKIVQSNNKMAKKSVCEKPPPAPYFSINEGIVRYKRKKNAANKNYFNYYYNAYFNRLDKAGGQFKSSNYLSMIRKRLKRYQTRVCATNPPPTTHANRNNMIIDAPIYSYPPGYPLNINNDRFNPELFKSNPFIKTKEEEGKTCTEETAVNSEDFGGVKNNLDIYRDTIEDMPDTQNIDEKVNKKMIPPNINKVESMVAFQPEPKVVPYITSALKVYQPTLDYIGSATTSPSLFKTFSPYLDGANLSSFYNQNGYYQLAAYYRTMLGHNTDYTTFTNGQKDGKHHFYNEKNVKNLNLNIYNNYYGPRYNTASYIPSLPHPAEQNKDAFLTKHSTQESQISHTSNHPDTFVNNVNGTSNGYYPEFKYDAFLNTPLPENNLNDNNLKLIPTFLKPQPTAHKFDKKVRNKKSLSYQNGSYGTFPSAVRDSKAKLKDELAEIFSSNFEITRLTPIHLRKAKLMFFYTRYPNSNILKTYFADIKFNRNNIAQLVKWFSNFREFFYIQIEKFARQALADGTTDNQSLVINESSELYRTLIMHYNRNNHIQVPSHFRSVCQTTLREFFNAICNCRDREPSWKKSIYKIIAQLDIAVPDYFKTQNFLKQLE
ncbi:unnamed protein product [Gordionus sp. m RMFG-2023]|uniref:uncharacterized protein LOC135927058 n=1 Tax=Gordionus sp. m RMFG-2023 TaxID=3053472 RepID=UPI0030E0256F